MARRKRKQYGSPPEAHWMSAKVAARNLRGLVADVRRRTATRACHGAYRALLRAFQTSGVLHAEILGMERHGVRSTKRTTFTRSKTGLAMIEKAAGRFEKACVISNRPRR